MQRLSFALVIVLLSATASWAKVETKTIAYEHAGQKLEGFLAWDDAVRGKRPGVLVVHEWWGLNDYARSRARQLAELGYVAFALDMYGEAKTAKHPAEAREMAGKVRANVQSWRERAQKGLDVLRSQDTVDPKRVAAIGYCFGGSTVLQLAFAGADVAGVVSFHGSLPAPEKDDLKKIRAKILVCHGAADAFIPAAQIDAFRAALDEAAADWQMVYYAGAKHSFTNPGADAAGLDGLKYDKNADQRSWAHMKLFFDEIFAKKA
jgi:dienelactone hydrolase